MGPVNRIVVKNVVCSESIMIPWQGGWVRWWMTPVDHAPIQCLPPPNDVSPCGGRFLFDFSFFRFVCANFVFNNVHRFCACVSVCEVFCIQWHSFSSENAM